MSDNVNSLSYLVQSNVKFLIQLKKKNQQKTMPSQLCSHPSLERTKKVNYLQQCIIAEKKEENFT